MTTDGHPEYHLLNPRIRLSHLVTGSTGAPQASPCVTCPWKTQRVQRTQHNECTWAARSHRERGQPQSFFPKSSNRLSSVFFLGEAQGEAERGCCSLHLEGRTGAEKKHLSFSRCVFSSLSFGLPLSSGASIQETGSIVKLPSLQRTPPHIPSTAGPGCAPCKPPEPTSCLHLNLRIL